MAAAQKSSTTASQNTPLDEKFLQAAADGMSLDCLDLLNCGARLDAQERAGQYATDLAAIGGHTHVCEALMERGADIKGPMFKHAVGYACYMGHKATVKALIAHGAPINTADANGWTPLHKAALMGREDICEELISHGADVHAKCLDGQTPLHKAPRSNSTPTALMLIKHGADVNVRDAKGRLPMHVANEHSNGTIKLLLGAYGADMSQANGDHKMHSPAKCCALLGLTERLLHLMDQGKTTPADDPQELARVARELGHEETAGAVLAHVARQSIRSVRALRASSETP